MLDGIFSRVLTASLTTCVIPPAIWFISLTTFRMELNADNELALLGLIIADILENSLAISASTLKFVSFALILMTYDLLALSSDSPNADARISLGL